MIPTAEEFLKMCSKNRHGNLQSILNAYNLDEIK